MGDSASERGIVGLPVERRRIVLPFYEHLCDTHVLTFQTRKGVFDVSGTASLLSSHLTRWLHLPRQRLHLRFSHLWRVCLIALMLLTYVAGMWAAIVSPSVAYAAAMSRQRASLVASLPKPRPPDAAPARRRMPVRSAPARR